MMGFTQYIYHDILPWEVKSAAMNNYLDKMLIMNINIPDIMNN